MQLISGPVGQKRGVFPGPDLWDPLDFPCDDVLDLASLL